MPPLLFATVPLGMGIGAAVAIIVAALGLI